MTTREPLDATALDALLQRAASELEHQSLSWEPEHGTPPPRRRRWQVAAVGIAAAAVALGGGALLVERLASPGDGGSVAPAAASEPSDPPTGPGDDPATSSWTTQATTIEQLVPPFPATMPVVHEARELLIRECMAARGFAYEPLPVPGYVPPSRSWHELSLEQAQRFGYHWWLATNAIEAAPERQALDDRTATDPAFASALNSTSDDPDVRGCYYTATDSLRPALSIDDYITIETAGTNATTSYTTDPQYQAALAGWVDCMAGRGHDYDDPHSPQGPPGDPRWATLETPSPIEIATAVDDATCRASTGYEQALTAAQQAWVMQWVASDADLAARLESADVELRARAEAILEQAGSADADADAAVPTEPITSPTAMTFDAVPDGFALTEALFVDVEPASAPAVLLGWDSTGAGAVDGEPVDLVPVLVVAGPFIDEMYPDGLPAERTVEVDGVAGRVGGREFDTGAAIEIGDSIVTVLVAGNMLYDEEFVGIGAALADPERLLWVDEPPADFVELGRRELERGPSHELQWRRGGETLFLTTTLDMYWLSEGAPPRVTAAPVDVDGLSGFVYTQDGSGATTRWLVLRMPDGTVVTLTYDNVGGSIDTVDLLELVPLVRRATDEEIAALDDQGLLTVWSDR